MSKPVLGAIWAQSLNGVIGRDGDMPWYAPEDLAHFKTVTLGAPVIMGRRTWESFPPRFCPLPGRTNIVITSSAASQVEKNGVLWVPSFDDALMEAAGEQPQTIWVIGGGSVYAEALSRADVPVIDGGRIQRVERTVFDLELTGDTYAPALDSSWRLVTEGERVLSEKGYGLSAEGTKLPLVMRFQTLKHISAP